MAPAASKPLPADLASESGTFGAFVKLDAALLFQQLAARISANEFGRYKDRKQQRRFYARDEAAILKHVPQVRRGCPACLAARLWASVGCKGGRDGALADSRAEAKGGSAGTAARQAAAPAGAAEAAARQAPAHCVTV